MDAVEAVLAFDGKHVDQLTAVVKNGITAAEWQALTPYFTDPNERFQTASTWLVKSLLENQQDLPQPVIDRLLTATDKFTSWEACLHVLQSIQFLQLSGTQRAKLIAFAQSCEGHKKTLVQVWALDAHIRLSISDNANIPDIQARLTNAQNHKAASMRARARNLQKEFKIDI